MADSEPVAQTPPPPPLSVLAEDVIKFCFPANILHPRSQSRLHTLAEYGPLYHDHSVRSCLCARCQRKAHEVLGADAPALLPRQAIGALPWLCGACSSHIATEVHLRSGYRGAHVVSDSELARMCELQEREDITSMFMPRGYLSAQEQERFLRTLAQCLQEVRHYAKDEIRAMIEPLTDGEGRIDFHVLSKVIRDDRAAGIRSRANPNFVYQQMEKVHRIKMSRRHAVRPADKPANASADRESERIGQLLHRNAFKITPFGQSKHANVNVRVMLDRDNDANTGWDPNFGIQRR